MATTVLVDKFQNVTDKSRSVGNEIDSNVFGRKMGVMARLFGCWHYDLSRPFTRGKTAYRSCMQCGARRQFNTETLETHGSFYFPPVSKEHYV
ncbi:MAG TPA: hypothetical protein VK892_17495 [Pyrinomonadaceae bacterium]|nr:hypothetical protein [Pyrinomonadaceae bacterium]